MGTVAAFNGMMEEFLVQMRRTGEKLGISDPGPMRVAQMALQQCQNSTDPKKQRYVLQKFAKYTVPHRDLIRARKPDGSFDEETFKEFLETTKKSPLMSAIGVHKFWDQLPEESKKGIWQFMNQLLIMATAITAIPEAMLGKIEEMAQSLVTQQASGDTSQMPNPADVFRMLGDGMLGGALPSDK